MFLLTITLWFATVNGQTDYYVKTFKTNTAQECTEATGKFAQEFAKNSDKYLKQGVTNVDINCTTLEKLDNVKFNKSIKEMHSLGGN